MAGTSQLPKPPDLGPDQENPHDWVLYLQQMLNWYYQMQVVNQDGEFGSQTQGVVERLRSQLHLSVEPLVDEEVWKKLGVEGTGGSGEVVDVDKTAELVQGDEDTSWAAAIAMVLTAKGETKTLDDVLGTAGAPRRRTAQEARQVAESTFHLSAHSCTASDGGSWSGVLNAHGVLWVPVPADDYHVFVVAGIRTEDGTVKIHVLDPRTGHDEWVAFDTFRTAYNIGDNAEIEVMAGE